MIIKISVCMLSLLQLVIFADEYTFDISEFDKKPFEYSGSIEFRPSLSIPQRNSYSWRLKHSENIKPPIILDNYLLVASPSGRYDKNRILLSGAADLRLEYNHSEDKKTFKAALLEGYGTFEFNSNWNFLAGKYLYAWGKGYIYNPVSYAGRHKDVNDIDASLEGYYSMSIHYNKSLPSPILKNISHEIVIMPVYKKLNDDFSNGDKHWLLNHSYFLIFDADIDLFINVAQDFDFTAGIAAAYNIRTNWEIHGELSYLPHTSKSIIGFDNSLDIVNKYDIIQSVVGTRYLSPIEATFYLEYVFNGDGLNNNEMNQWYSAANTTLANQDLQSINRIRSLWFDNIGKQFQTQHYIYFKVQYPEPFDFHYFTPSLYTLVNVIDQSLTGGLDLNYKRLDNLSFNLKIVGLFGNDTSEFGSKIAQQKTELNSKFYF